MCFISIVKNRFRFSYVFPDNNSAVAITIIRCGNVYGVLRGLPAKRLDGFHSCACWAGRIAQSTYCRVHGQNIGSNVLRARSNGPRRIDESGQVLGICRLNRIYQCVAWHDFFSRRYEIEDAMVLDIV